MPQTHDPPLRTFNPGTFQSDAEVCRQFVIRQWELSSVLARLRRNTAAGSRRHVLLEGPRGIGKTMLLARIAAELRTNPAFQDYVAIQLPEENPEVFTLGDFWLEVLRYLASAVGRSHPKEHQNIVRAHAQLLGDWGSETFQERALAAVLDGASSLGNRKLVIMVENLQDLCAHVDEDFSPGLKQALTNHPTLILVATATTVPPDAAFAALLHTFRLEPLDTSACSDLWAVAAGRLAATEPQLMALRQLTGGNPRLLVILGRIAVRRGAGAYRIEDFLGAIDEHTEYFRRQLAELPKTERRVYLAVADLWDFKDTVPLTAIAERARLDVRKTATMLGRLVKRGMLLKPEGRHRYDMAERIFVYYYKMRRREFDSLAVNFIRFIDKLFLMPVALKSVQNDVRSGRRENAVAALGKLRLAPAGDTASPPASGTDTAEMNGPDGDALRELAAATVGHHAVVDDHGRVVHLTLTVDERGVPAAIGDLKGLKSLWIGGFGGDVDLPDVLGELQLLKRLRVNCGRVLLPKCGEALAGLDDFDLVGDVAWRGSIAALRGLRQLLIQGCWENEGGPRALGELTRLRRLTLTTGAVAKGLGEALGRLQGLESLDLAGKLTEDVAVAIGGLKDLESLRLVRTSPGPIPASIERLARLRSLCLTGQFEGGITDVLTSRSELRRLILFGPFDGEIPESIGALKKLEWLILHGDFTGAIPDTIGRLTELTNLCIEGQLSGELPKSIGELTKLRWLTLSGNFTGEAGDIFNKLTALSILDLPAELKGPAEEAVACGIFRRAYGEFDPDDNAPIGHLVNQAARCIGAGVSAGTLLEILQGDGYRAKALAPLIAALRIREGESIGDAREIAEIAKYINARMAKYINARIEDGGSVGKTYESAWRLWRQIEYGE